jgi:hypothetical protein
VAIENFCLDCGESIRVVVRDGIIESDEPPGICGYVDIPFRDWRKNFPYT